MLQNINGWHILETEDDQTMPEHASHPRDWHESFVDHLVQEYFRDKPMRTAVDVGSSYGWMSVGLVEYFDYVHSFELRDDVRYAQSINLAAHDNITIYPFGLGSRDREVMYGVHPATGGTSLIRGWDRDRIASATSRVVPLDSLGLEDVDLIKIDVEDYELEVLRGSRATIEKYRPVVIAEIYSNRSPTHFDYRQQLFGLLREFGYQIMDVRYNDYVFVSNG